MLFEKTTYPDDFPIDIKIAEVTEYPLHYHQDVEFVYVLKGELTLRNGSCTYLLKEGDIFTNSGHEVHSLAATEKENQVAVIHVSSRFFTQYFPSLNTACFRTYVNRDVYLQLDTLRKMLLHILLDFAEKSFGYKTQCVYQMVDVIRYMNENFNLFAFEDRVVVNFKHDNPVTVERISRIINYVYENHAHKLTLESLAEREHLNPYYLSHFIRAYMGISFQEFLCFARVEMSEILLLETGKKISAVARESGFSTTAYYEKYFLKWFGCSPRAHREQFLPQILGPDRPARLQLLSGHSAIILLKSCLSAVNSLDNNPSRISQLQLNVEIDPAQAPIRRLAHHLEVLITLEDYRAAGEKLFSILADLQAASVVLLLQPSDNPDVAAALLTLLKEKGFEARAVTDCTLTPVFSSGHDSIAAPLYLFDRYLAAEESLISCRLRDQGSLEQVLKGSPAVMTSALIAKPAYYACQWLGAVGGELLALSKYYAAVRCTNPSSCSSPLYIILAFHGSDEISRLCLRQAGRHETGDTIIAFRDEMNLHFTMQTPPGTYRIIKYALSEENSIFSYMQQMGFLKADAALTHWLHKLNTKPSSHCRLEEVTESLEIHFTLRGAEIQLAVIEKSDGAEDADL